MYYAQQRPEEEDDAEENFQPPGDLPPRVPEDKDEEAASSPEAETETKKTTYRRSLDEKPWIPPPQ